jgi:hypothetical protein
MLATEAGGGGSRQRRVGEGQIGGLSDSVNRIFAILLRDYENSLQSVI